MTAFAARTTIDAPPTAVLAWLTDPAACARWAPLPVDVTGLSGDRFRPGSRARISGRLAGRGTAFDVRVGEVSARRFVLRADGPFTLDVEYELLPAGDGRTVVTVTAAVSRARGLQGRAMAGAAGALMAGGLLDRGLARLARSAQAGSPALVALAA